MAKRRVPGRPKGNVKFDAALKERFLRELASTGRFYDSSAACGIDYTTMLTHRKGGEMEDLAFEQGVQVALEEYRDTLREEVHRRGVSGWVERGVFDSQGHRLGDVRKYSDRLLELHVKRLDPEYRERLAVDATTKVEGGLQLRHVVELEATLKAATPEQRAKLREALEAFAPVEEVEESS